MATATTNYGWSKPSYEDDADIMVINDTIDGIDSQMKTNENAINGKQAALNSSQLDAVNSGIDSTKVEQIETNKTNISTLQKKTTQPLSIGGNTYLEISLSSNDTNNRGAFLISIPYQSSSFASCLYMVTVGVAAGISGTGIIAYTRLDTQANPNVFGVTVSADKKKLYFQVQTNSWASPVIIPLFDPSYQPTITASWLDSIPT